MPADKAAPTPLHALAIWFSSAVVLILAGLVVGLVAAGQVSAQGGNPAEVLMDPERSPLFNNPTWIALGTLTNELAVAGALLAWWFLLRPKRELVFPMLRPTPRGVAGALLVTFGAAPWAQAAGELVHRIVQNDITASKIVIAAARGASGGELVFLLFCISVMPALVEESLFRGMLTAAFRRSFWVALTVPSILFGLFHLEPTQAAGTILLGMAFALARLCTGSLSAAMIAHGVYNATVILMVRYSEDVAESRITLGPLLVGAALVVAGASLLMREMKLRHVAPPPHTIRDHA